MRFQILAVASEKPLGAYATSGQTAAGVWCSVPRRFARTWATSAACDLRQPRPLARWRQARSARCEGDARRLDHRTGRGGMCWSSVGPP